MSSSLTPLPAARSSAADREQHDRLLSGVLQIFSLIANSDGQVHEDELHYVEVFLESLHPEDTRRLLEDFKRNLDDHLALEPTIAGLKDAFSYEEKLFVLGKSFEMLDGHRISESEIVTAREIASRLGIESADAAMMEAHLLHENGTASRTLTPARQVHVLRLSDNASAPDELCLTQAGLRAEIFALAGGFYIRQRDERQTIMMGVHRLRRNFLTKIRRLDSVRIGSLVLRQGDLPFYLHRAAKMDQPQSLFLSSAGNAISVAVRAPETPAKLQLYLEGILMIASSPHPEAVSVNGTPLVKPRRLLLGDSITLDNLPLDLRKLLFNHLPDEFLFHAKGQACSISNKPDADLHVTDRHGKRWEAKLRSDGTGAFHLERGDCPHPVLRRGKPLPAAEPLRAGARFTLAGCGIEIDGDTVRRYPPGVQSYGADQLSFVFPDASVALDRIAFEAERGDLICILGPSGCGKSTLLSMLTGQYEPTKGAVRLDGFELHRHQHLVSRIGFVPQDDLLFENLTVGENLEFSARLRDPFAPAEKIEGNVRKALREVGLRERRHVRAGGPLDKTLSGGERKRLNIGLELLGDYEILLLDEPTSGLSSGDAMKVIEVLKNRSLDGGIVFVVAHQPSAKLLELFDKVLLLDKGGKVAFFGDVAAAFRYFHAHEQGEIANPAGETIALDADFLFEALERTSLRIDGTPDRSRRHPPEYWQDRFAKYRTVHMLGRLTHTAPTSSSADLAAAKPKAVSRLGQFLTLLHRETLNKLRNRFNLLVSLGSAAGLALIVGLACRESVDGVYELAKNFAFGNFLFLTTVVVLFLALSGSVTEIVKDRAIRLRERLLGIPPSLYLLSKLIPLVVILLIQIALYETASFAVLGVRELWLEYWLMLGIAGFTGLAIGLFFSALPGMTDKAASALIPILLVPQIILSGANPFPFHRMAHLHWPGARPTDERTAGQDPPWASQVMPSRWTYEALVCLQRDKGFEAEYERALGLLRQHRMAERTMDEATEKPGSVEEKELAEAKAVLARLTPATVARAEATKASGEMGGSAEARRMTKFANSFSSSGTPSAPPSEAHGLFGGVVSRAWYDTGVLARMGLAWLLGAWLILRFGPALARLLRLR